MRPFALGGSAYLLVYNLLYLTTRGQFNSPDSLSEIYLVFISLYAGAPEVKRWMTKADPSDPEGWQERLRKGGPLITLWVLLYAAAVTWRIYDPSRPIPPELKEITLQTMLVFFGSFALRQARKRAIRQEGGGVAQNDEELQVRKAVTDLLKQKGQAAPKELAAAVLVPRRSLNRILADMVREGLITRGSAAPTDAYAPYTLTS